MIFFKPKQSNGLTDYLSVPHSYSLEAVGIPERKLISITSDCTSAARARDAIWSKLNQLSVKYAENAFKSGNFASYVALTVVMAKFLQEESRPKDALNTYLRAAYYYVNFERGMQAVRIAEKGKKSQCSALLHDSFLRFPFDIEEIFILDADNGIMDLYMFMMQTFARFDSGVFADYELTRALAYAHDDRRDDLERLCETVAERLVYVMGLPQAVRHNTQTMKESEPLLKEYEQANSKIESEWALISNLQDYQGERAEDFINLCGSVINQYCFFKMADESISRIKTVPAYKRLVMLFEKRQEYDLAARVCCGAIRDGIDMKKQLARNIGKQQREPTQQEERLLNETL